MLIIVLQQHIWTQEFVDHTEDLLAALLAQEVLPNDGICMQCAEPRLAIWRCKDCTLSPVLCRACMCHCHLNNLLHCIKCWTGAFFHSADLWEVSVYFLVQHQREELPCRSLCWQKEFLERLQLSQDDKEQRRLSMASHSHSQSVLMAPHSGNVPMHPDQLSKDNNSGDEEEEWDGENNAELESIHGYLGDTISAAL